jgi:hypothetical protein
VLLRVLLSVLIWPLGTCVAESKTDQRQAASPYAPENYRGISSYAGLRRTPGRLVYEDNQRRTLILFLAPTEADSVAIVQGRMRTTLKPSRRLQLDEFSATCEDPSSRTSGLSITWADGHEVTFIQPAATPNDIERYPYNLWWAACRGEYNKFRGS